MVIMSELQIIAALEQALKNRDDAGARKEIGRLPRGALGVWALKTAAQQGMTATVKALLEHSPPAEEKDYVLIAAIESGRPEVFRMVLRHATVNECVFSDRLLRRAAAEGREPEEYQFSIRLQAVWENGCKEGALTAVIKSCQPMMLKDMLAHGVTEDHCRDVGAAELVRQGVLQSPAEEEKWEAIMLALVAAGMVPHEFEGTLYAATLTGCNRLVKMLVESGAVHEWPQNLWEPNLMTNAVCAGNLTALRLFEQLGIDLSCLIGGARDNNPLYWAVVQGNRAILGWMAGLGLAHQALKEYLPEAIKHGRVKVLEWMWERGVTAKYYRELNCKALKLMVKAEQPAMMEWLLSRAGPAIITADVFWVAAKLGRRSVLDWIWQKGMAPQQTVPEGVAPEEVAERQTAAVLEMCRCRNLSGLKWMRKAGLLAGRGAFGKNNVAMRAALSAADAEIVDWMLQIKAALPRGDEEVVRAAEEMGALDRLISAGMLPAGPAEKRRWDRHAEERVVLWVVCARRTGSGLDLPRELWEKVVSFWAPFEPRNV